MSFQSAYINCTKPFVASSQATWNSFGLLSSNANVYQKKAERASALANRNDICGFQETHGDAAAAVVFASRLEDHVLDCSFNRVRSKGGLVTTVKCALIRKISESLGNKSAWTCVIDKRVTEHVIPGRLHIVTFSWSDVWKVRVINLHVPPDWSVADQIIFLRKVRSRILNPAVGLTIVLGDFNFGIDEADHLNITNPVEFRAESAVAKFWCGIK